MGVANPTLVTGPAVYETSWVQKCYIRITCTGSNVAFKILRLDQFTVLIAPFILAKNRHGFILGFPHFEKVTDHWPTIDPNKLCPEDDWIVMILPLRQVPPIFSNYQNSEKNRGGLNWTFRPGLCKIMPPVLSKNYALFVITSMVLEKNCPKNSIFLMIWPR